VGQGADTKDRAAIEAAYEFHDRAENEASRALFADHQPALDVLQEDVLDALNREGIAVFPITSLFPQALWERLRDDVSVFADRVERELAVANAELTQRRDGPKPGKKEKQKDRFLRRRLAGGAQLDAGDPWLELAVSSRLLDIVNSYQQLWAKLIYADQWYTVPVAGNAARAASQRWHRDSADRHLVKVFIYFSDVDDEAGPFEYIPGSARNGEYADCWPWSPGGDMYPPAEEFAEVIPDSAIRTLTGPAGTMILCNTSGFHRGGYARSRPRVMSVFTYVSPASMLSVKGRRFQLDPSELPHDFPAPARFALS
jgi:hypothetical protein